MPLLLKRQRDGRLREVWYGRYAIQGKFRIFNLNVKIAGTPPASLSLRDEGDAAFERSRATAQAKLDGVVEQARSGQNAERLVEKLYEIKTGEQLKSVKLSGLADEWARIQRKRKPDERYASQCKSTLNRFVAFVQKENAKASELAHVTRTIARGFMDAEAKRGVSAKTWNDVLKLLRATFKYLLPAGAINPFIGLPTKDTETVFRIPFSPEELKAITDAARDDDFIRPILVTGICTAMRRGDCCLLQRKDVDLKNRFITVKTAKTGQTVSIPIFPMLYDELAGRLKGGEGQEIRRVAELGGRVARATQSGKDYVFPEQAAMYLENPDGITARVQKILRMALQNSDSTEESNLLPRLGSAETRERGMAYLATVGNAERRGRMQAVFEAYLDRVPTKDIRALHGASKGTVSGYLNEIERNAAVQIIRGRAVGKRVDADLLSQARNGGLRRASVRDFHSFRVTWVTLALTAGVPLELVQKVTGHKTTDIVLKHYFQPGREAFRQALHSAMPKLLTNGQKSPKDEMREIIEGMTAKTWKKGKKRMLELLCN